MVTEKVVDASSGRAFTLDAPDTPPPGGVTLVLNLHGGGSVGPWQREYFPAYEHVDSHGLVVATPTAATKEPFRMWVAEADDAHLQAVVELVLSRYEVRSFWLAGHSQGGMTANRLLRTPWFADRVDGWLSLSGGRLGPADPAPGFGPPTPPGQPPYDFSRLRAALRPATGPHEADFSFVYAIGEHEIVALPETSPWAERYGAGPRVRLEDVVDDQPGKTHDTTREAYSTPAWGLRPGPGTAEVWVYPGAEGGRLVADVVRRGKGHTEGLEPRVTERLVEMLVQAPGGKLQRLPGRAPTAG